MKKDSLIIYYLFVEISSIKIQDIETFQAQKIRQGKLAKFIKILNYILYIYIYIYIYIIRKKELKHFGAEILAIHSILDHIVLNIFKCIC